MHVEVPKVEDDCSKPEEDRNKERKHQDNLATFARLSLTDMRLLGTSVRSLLEPHGGVGTKVKSVHAQDG